MDIYLTDTKGARVTIPILPDRVSVKTGAMTQTFQIIKFGEIKIPRGKSATGYSWNSIFPSESMESLVASFGRTWEHPNNLVSQFVAWEEANETLRLMITETAINADVFIDTFTYDYFGVGNVSYTLNLSIRGALTVTTVPAPTKPVRKSGGSSDSKTYGIVSTSGSKLKVRKKPKSNATVIGKLANGTRIEILDTQGNWYVIPHEKGKDGKGYVYKSYVKLESSGSGGGGSSGSGKSGGGSGKGGGGNGGGGGTNATYTTKTGDSLASIAKAYGVDATALWNLNADAIRKAGGSMSKIPVGIALQIPSQKKDTPTVNTSKVPQVVKQAASAVATAISKVATGLSSLISSIPTKKVTNVASTASKIPVVKPAQVKKTNLTK